MHGAFRQYGEHTEHLCTPGSLAINTAGAEHRDRFEARTSEVLNIELDPHWLATLHDEGARDPGRVRAEHARRALCATNAPLHAIALEAGYADQSHMTRELAALVGCTPGRLRHELGAR